MKYIRLLWQPITDPIICFLFRLFMTAGLLDFLSHIVKGFLKS